MTIGTIDKISIVLFPLPYIATLLSINVMESCCAPLNQFISNEPNENEEEEITYCANILDLFTSKSKNCNDFGQIITPKKKRKNEENRPKATHKIKSDRHSIANKFLKHYSLKKNPFNGYTDTQFFNINDATIVVLESNSKIHFHGFFELKILHGKVEVLGHELNTNSKAYTLCSPRGSSSLYIHNITDTNTPIPLDILTNLPNLKVLNNNSAIIRCGLKKEHKIEFIEKHMSQCIFPSNEKVSLSSAVFDVEDDNSNPIQVGSEWNDVIEQVDADSKLLICGGKGTGKSTFLRYAINRLLMKFEEVQVLDLDPGQPEFTVAGCISLIKVKEPVFGVNYTHLRQAELSILSNISIEQEIKKYLNSAKLLNDHLENGIPTLINYMGFTQGLGLNIISSLIVSLEPSDVLQIISVDDIKKNFSCDLTPDIVTNNAMLFEPNFNTKMDYTLHKINSIRPNNTIWSAQSKELREMGVLSYFGQSIQANSIFSSKVPMYTISLDNIHTTDLRGAKISLAAINANLVALCCLKSSSVFQCLGWGIVRGVDLSINKLTLITVEELSILENVTHLVLSSVTLPPSLYMTTDEVIGKIPYVLNGDLISFGQIPKRSRISKKKK